MSDVADEVVVRKNPEDRLYEAVIGDEVVGNIVYELEGDRVVMTHTVVDPGRRGQGIASKLVRAALDDVRAQGKKITVYCTVVGGFINEHPEYADLIDPIHPGHASAAHRDKS